MRRGVKICEYYKGVLKMFRGVTTMRRGAKMWRGKGDKNLYYVDKKKTHLSID